MKMEISAESMAYKLPVQSMCNLSKSNIFVKYKCSEHKHRLKKRFNS